jgi:hypothetical protein
MLVAVVGGVTARLIVDSGASHHVLTMDLVEAAHLVATPAESGSDHSGKSIQTFAVGVVDVALGGASWKLTEVAAIATIPQFKMLGIGGFLSPQHLHGSAYTLMDFPRSSLAVMEGTSAEVAAALGRQNQGMRVLTLVRASRDRKVFIEASVVPEHPGQMELDSGGSATEVLASSLQVDSAPTGNSGFGVSGTEVVSMDAGKRTLVLGGVNVSVAHLMARPTMGQADMVGVVGMDVLRATVMAVTRDVAQPVVLAVPTSRSN